MMVRDTHQSGVCLALFAVFAAACSDDRDTTSVTSEEARCVESRWSGDLVYDGEWLDVQTCLGDECTGREQVSVRAGTSCRVEVTDPPPLTPSATRRPEGEGPGYEDVTHRVLSDGGMTEFSICVTQSPEAAGGAIDTVHLDVVVTPLGVPTRDDMPDAASLEVFGSSGAALVDTRVAVGPLEGAGTCVVFALSLDGTPLDTSVASSP